MPLTPGTRLGLYEILAPLGAGGMGEVYRARDAKLNRDVAIKILPDSVASDAGARARFEREAQAIAALSHPNILAIFDFGVDENVPYAVMELLDGQTLRELASVTVAPRKAIEYAQQIAAGLGAAHARGITHRDLKPENVFVTRDGRIKILDFGLAKVGSATAAPSATPSMLVTSPALTDPGTIVGTVGYMSPEQVRGREVDHRSDIFSFGAILYELLSGQRAFSGDSAVETMNAILKEDPPDFSRANAALPPALDRIVRRCLEKSPDERFQSARDVAFALDAISTTRSDSAIPIAPVAEGRRGGKAVWLAACGVLAAAAAAVAFLAGSRLAAPSALQLTRLTFDRGTVRSARFAPDGKTIVYGAAWHGEPIKIFQTRLGSPESIPLQLPDADVLAIARSGEMAVALGRRFEGWLGTGTLARAPAVGGAPREILEAVTTADWSASNGEFAIVRRLEGKDRLEYPIGKVLYETTGYVSHPRVSPSGDAIAFLDHPIYSDNRGWVSIVSTSAGRKRLTKEWGGVEGLTWSPDGREIWYTGSESSRSTIRGVTPAGVDREVWTAPADLAILDASSDGRVLVTANSIFAESKWFGAVDTQPRDISWFAWARANDISHDGRTVLFTRFDEGAGLDYQMGLRHLDSSTAVGLGTGQAIALSPDSKWVLGIMFSQSGIFTVPTGPGERRTLTRAGLKYTAAGWFPDSQRILFIAEATGEPAAAYIQDLGGGEPRKVTSRLPATPGAALVRISPDGKWFFVEQSSGAPVIVSLDGRETRVLTGLGEADALKAWTDGGRGLIVARRAADLSNFVLSRVDRDTGRSDTLRTIPIGDTTGHRGLSILTTPDASAVAFTVQRYLTDLYLVEGLK